MNGTLGPCKGHHTELTYLDELEENNAVRAVWQSNALSNGGSVVVWSD